MNPVQTQHIQWLSEQLRDSEGKLVEARDVVAEAKQNIAYLKKMIKIVKDGADPKTEINNGVNQENSHNNDTIEPGDLKRTPKQMLLIEYEGMVLGDAIHACLFDTKTKSATEDMIQDMFDVQT